MLQCGERGPVSWLREHILAWLDVPSLHDMRTQRDEARQACALAQRAAAHALACASRVLDQPAERPSRRGDSDGRGRGVDLDIEDSPFLR